jgi:hypothetical protein
MSVNLTTSPYYDDYDETKNYVKVLFKPGYAVQARELTQLQTAIQRQISRFGDHVFKDGSLVLNGNTTLTQAVWVLVDTTAPNALVDKTFVGQQNGASFKVMAVSPTSTTAARVYGVMTNGAAFVSGETLVSADGLQSVTISTDEEFSGTGTVFSIDQSVFYVNGYFVVCNSQRHIVSFAGDASSKRIGLIVNESIVSHVDDATLLDPAQGSYNFAAPGADRVSIDLSVASFDYDPTASQLATIPDFIELVRIVDGKLVFQITGASYSEIENTLARRTYDESGDYTTKAFSATVVPHIRAEPLKYSIEIGPGKAYVKGYEFETIASSYIDIDRAFDTSKKEDYSTDVSFGNFFYVSTPTGAPIDYVANVKVNVNNGANVIGSCYVRHIERVTGGSYRLYVYGLSLTRNASVTDITGFSSNAWSAAIDATRYPSGTQINEAPNKTSLIRLPNSHVKTLLEAGSDSATEYQTQIKVTATVSGFATTISSGSGRTFASSFVENYVVVDATTGNMVMPLSVTLGTGNTSASFTFNTATISQIHIYAPVVYFGVREKTKTLQTRVLTVAATSNKISLDRSDCYALTSVKAQNSQDVSPTPIDVTSSFVFNNGQTDELYDHGWIQLKTGFTLPPMCDQLVVEFTQFTQNITDGFFSVDSYPVDYDQIPVYLSKSGTTFNLADCLDFRPRRADGASDIIGQAVAFPRSRISFDYEYYLSRIDKLVLTKERQFSVVRGVPAERPTVPSDLYDAMTLYVLTIPPYTATPSTIKTAYVDNRRYTMRDIGKIDKRVERIEYYTALSLLEKQAKDEVIYDNLGVERFKNGILVDSFAGHSVGDVNNIDYLCAINKEDRTLRPRFASHSFDFNVSSTTGYRRGDLLALPVVGTEVLVEQPFATGVCNLNPFLVFSWKGQIELNPATDTWVDTQTRPAVVVNMNGENDVYTTLVPNVNNPASTGVVWNDWQTVVRGVTTSQSLSNQLSITEQTVGGATLETTTSAISSTLLTSTDTSSFRTGLEISTSAVTTVQRDLGSRVVDMSVVPFIRSRPVDFSATDLKPFTSLYALFDNKDVTKYCTPAIEIEVSGDIEIPADATELKNIAGTKTAKIILARANTAFIVMAETSAAFSRGEVIQWVVDGVASSTTTPIIDVIFRTSLETNVNGDVAGVFLIPNNDTIKFSTGEKIFRLTDDFSTRPRTAAEVKYVAQGMSQTIEKTIVATRVATASVNPTQQTSSAKTTTTSSSVTATASVTLDITEVPEPIRIRCSIDEDTGDFSDGKRKTSEYTLSYNDFTTTTVTGAAGLTSIVVSSTNGIYAGMVVSGTGIATGSRVVSLTGTSVTLSAANTGPVSGTATFRNDYRWIGIKYQLTDVPVRYTLHYEGKTATTGFVGSAAYNAKLAGLSLPNVVGPGTGVLFVQRSSADVETARLVVESPFDGCDWEFNVPAPFASSPAATLRPPTFTITANKNRIEEGDPVTFTVKTTNIASGTVLNWRLVGDNVNASDFTDGQLTGSLTINNSSASFTKTAREDITLEGDEFFVAELMIGSNVVATSQSVNIVDTSIPSYEITANKSRINEGELVTFNIATKGVANGSVLSWAIAGTNITGSDFTDGQLTGSVTISSGKASFSKTAAADITTEGTESFIVTLSSGATAVASSQTVTIVDTSLTPTYEVVADKTRIAEGEAVTFNVITTNVASGTTLNWAIAGANVTGGDFTDSTLTGTVLILNNRGTIVRTARVDATTEGNETFVLTLKNGAVDVAKSQTVTIVDTSLTPTYSITPSVTTVNEGSSVRFDIRTTNVPNGTVLSWTIVGNDVTTGDFVGLGSLSGTSTVSNGAASFTLTTSTTDEDESNEAFVVRLSAGGAQVATSSSVTIVNVVRPRNVSAEITTTTPTAVVPNDGQAVLRFNTRVVGTNVNPSAQYRPTIVAIEGRRQRILNRRLVTEWGPLTGITSSMPTNNVTVGSWVAGTLTVPGTIMGGLFTSLEQVRVIIRWTYVGGDDRIPTALRTLEPNRAFTVTQPPMWDWGGGGGGGDGGGDPVAQTFFVDARTYPNGVFVDSVDLYFAKKAPAMSARVEIRPTVNGYPSADTILPFARSSLLPHQIKTSTDGSVPTNFKFENLVCLAPGEYALVALSDSDEFEVYTSTLGDYTVGANPVRVTAQPTLGSLFKSQNASTWTPVQEEDLKFRLHKCVFAPNVPATATLAAKVSPETGNVDYDVFYATGEMIDFASTEATFEYKTATGTWTPYQMGSNALLPSPQVLTSSANSLQMRATMSTSDRNITPVIDLNRLSSVLVHNLINDDTTGEDGENNGNAVAKYVTKKVKLAPGFDATDIKVYFFANVPTPSSVKVYYKVSSATDESFDDNLYVEMQMENSGVFSENRFVEYKYKTPFVLDNNSVAIDTGERFDTFAIKIVMLSPDSTKVPTIRDLRVIALDD